MPNQSEILKQRLCDSIARPFEDLLPGSKIETILEEQDIRYRKRLYTPIVTIWGMVYQVLCADKSLSNTVHWLRHWLVPGAEAPSSNTGAYSKARSRLPEGVIEKLVPEMGQALDQQVSSAHLWCDRVVKVFDGSTLLMSDTQANQTAYPQHGNQKKGCGFGMARIVVFFSLVTGVVRAAAMASKKTSEAEMSRALYATLEPGDVAMADQLHGSYVDLALSQQQRADGMIRKHHARKTDFRTGKKNGIGDHQVDWSKPSRRPKHMSKEAFDALPDTLTVREVSLRLTRKGWREQCIIVVTTLLDAQTYSAQALTQLYGCRWYAAEVNLRHVKTTLKLEMLTAKTPSMVRKEFWTHLLSYNLLRTIMEQAAPKAEHQRARLSLQTTRQGFRTTLDALATGEPTVRERVYADLLNETAKALLPYRPNRQEPRVVKQRPKPFPRMQEPRAVLKAKLAA
ncbi:MAG: IS4 family transposase [Symploca sp. SIO3C6]|nr:IS4 family transposase [Symploca sp. SIO3C6]